MIIRKRQQEFPSKLIQLLNSRKNQNDDLWKWKFISEKYSGYYYIEKEEQSNNEEELHKEEVTSFMGLMHFYFKADNQTVRYSWIVDWVASENSVGEGVSLLKYAQKENTVLCLQGSKFTREILTTLRWKEYILNGTQILPNTINFISIMMLCIYNKKFSFLFSAGKFFLSNHLTKTKSISKYIYNKVDYFTHSEIDDIALNNGSSHCLLRNCEYLNFRFSDFPELVFSKYLIKYTGSIIGYIVVTVVSDHNGMKNIRLVDLNFLREYVCKDLIQSITSFIKKNFFGDYLSVFITDKIIKDYFTSLGFKAIGHTRVWIPPKLNLKPQDWYMTFIDCDRAWR